MRFQFMLISIVLCGGCASTHNLNSGPNYLGGGVQHSEVKPGIYSILARTNWAPWSNYSAAQSSWTKVAESLCGAGKYQELNISERAYDTGLPQSMGLPYIVTERTGYALCSNSSLSLDEIRDYLIIKTKSQKSTPGQELSPRELFGLGSLEIRVPNNAGWRLVKKDSSNIAFGKKGIVPNETFIASISIFPLSPAKNSDEFVSKIRIGVAQDNPSDRFNTIEAKFTYTEERGYTCVRFQGLFDDKQALTAPSAHELLKLQVHALYCRHPIQSNLGFVTTYSHRGGALIGDLDTDARTFQESLQVTASN